MLLRVGRIDQIHWKTVFRIVVPLAAAVGLLTLGRSPFGYLLLLPGGVVLAVHIYRLRQPFALRAWQGAKVGLCTGVLSVAFFAVFLVAEAGINPALYRQNAEETIRTIKERQASNPSPDVERLLEKLSDPQKGLVLSGILEVLSAAMFLPLTGGIAGAVAASLMKSRATQ